MEPVPKSNRSVFAKSHTTLHPSTFATLQDTRHCVPAITPHHSPVRHRLPPYHQEVPPSRPLFSASTPCHAGCAPHSSTVVASSDYAAASHPCSPSLASSISESTSEDMALDLDDEDISTATPQSVRLVARSPLSRKEKKVGYWRGKDPRLGDFVSTLVCLKGHMNSGMRLCCACMHDSRRVCYQLGWRGLYSSADLRTDSSFCPRPSDFSPTLHTIPPLISHSYIIHSPTPHNPVLLASCCTLHHGVRLALEARHLPRPHVFPSSAWAPLSRLEQGL